LDESSVHGVHPELLDEGLPLLEALEVLDEEVALAPLDAEVLEVFDDEVALDELDAEVLEVFDDELAPAAVDAEVLEEVFDDEVAVAALDAERLVVDEVVAPAVVVLVPPPPAPEGAFFNELHAARSSTETSTKAMVAAVHPDLWC
jgi:hypothetical protein